MKKLLLSAIATVALSASALAADLPARTYTKAPPPLPVAPYYDWSGFYIGANGGYGWSHIDQQWIGFDGVSFPPVPGAEGPHQANGGLVGGQLGWRMQSGAFVWGIDLAGDWADLIGSNTDSFGTVFTTHTTGLGTFAGTIGWASNNVLFYFRGGGAVTENNHTAVNPNVGSVALTSTRWGADVGAGVEYGFTPNWSFAVQYDHLFMGTRAETLTGTPGTFTNNISQDVDMVTGRINFRFGGPMVARY